MDIVEVTKEYFLKTVKKAGPEYFYLERHLPEVEKWAKKILIRKPEANETIVMLGVWLHDIGQILGNQENDHAINSEKEAKRFLKENDIDEEVVNAVAHCVRAHRCKDIQPQTLEAKIVAVADSASHMTDIIYIDMASRGDIEDAKAKLERDFRDKGLFPEFQEESKALYEAWKRLLEVFPKE